MIQRRGRGCCRATPVHPDAGGPLDWGEWVEAGWALCWVSSVQQVVKTVSSAIQLTHFPANQTIEDTCNYERVKLKHLCFYYFQCFDNLRYTILKKTLTNDNRVKLEINCLTIGI